MSVVVFVRNESSHKRVPRTAELRRLAEHVCDGEKMTGALEVSVLFCGDVAIAELNRKYRHKDTPTDVLAFAQTPASEPQPWTVGVLRPLGDIVISLDTVARRCTGPEDEGLFRAAMRQEIRLLFCHGLLHLLGLGHASEKTRAEMNVKQARYLGIGQEAAWHFPHKPRGR